MEGKQLKGNLIDIARSLRSKFDIENANDDVKANDHPQDILTIQAKRRRPGEDSGMENITRSMQDLTFLMTGALQDGGETTC